MIHRNHLLVSAALLTAITTTSCSQGDDITSKLSYAMGYEAGMLFRKEFLDDHTNHSIIPYIDDKIVIKSFKSGCLGRPHRYTEPDIESIFNTMNEIERSTR